MRLDSEIMTAWSDQNNLYYDIPKNSTSKIWHLESGVVSLQFCSLPLASFQLISIPRQSVRGSAILSPSTGLPSCYRYEIAIWTGRSLVLLLRNGDLRNGIGSGMLDAHDSPITPISV